MTYREEFQEKKLEYLTELKRKINEAYHKDNIRVVT